MIGSCINVSHLCELYHDYMVLRKRILISLFAGRHCYISTTICISLWSKEYFALPQIRRILSGNCERKHEVISCCFCRVPSLSSWRVHLCWWTVPVEFPVAVWWGFWLPRPLWWSTYQHQVQKFRFVCNFSKNACDLSFLRVMV